MAQVVIVLQDVADSVNVRVDFEPQDLPARQTLAQILGAIALKAIRESLNQEPESPRIQLLS